MAACTHLYTFRVVHLCAFIGFCYDLITVEIGYIANLPQGNIIIILLPKSQGKITYMHYETSTAST